MFFKRFFRFVLVSILLLGIFGIFSSAAYRSGWSEGFASAQSVDGQPVENVPPNSPHRSGGFVGGIFSLFGWAIAAFFKFWLFIFFIGFVFKFLFWGGRRRHRRGRFGRWGGGHCGRGWHKWHHDHGDHGKHGKGDGFKGNRPPWFDDSDGEPVMKA